MVDQVLAVVVQLASGSWNTIFTPAHWQVISWPLVAVTACVRHSATMSMPLAMSAIMSSLTVLPCVCIYIYTYIHIYMYVYIYIY